MIDTKRLDKIMCDLGYPSNLSGTAMLKKAVELYRFGVSYTKELYPAAGKAFGKTGSATERAMRHAIVVAVKRATPEAIEEYFGNSISPDNGVPCVSHVIARLHELCEVEG